MFEKEAEEYANISEPHKVVYPLGASYRQYDNRTPNELFSDTEGLCSKL